MARTGRFLRIGPPAPSCDTLPHVCLTYIKCSIATLRDAGAHTWCGRLVMSGIETIYLAFIVGAFVVFALLLMALESGERRRVGYRSGPIPLDEDPTPRT